MGKGIIESFQNFRLIPCPIEPCTVTMTELLVQDSKLSQWLLAPLSLVFTHSGLMYVNYNYTTKSQTSQ